MDYLITKDRNNRLIEEVNKLDDIYKSVLELKYINEFSNDEIALFLKIKKKTVEMRLYRAYGVYYYENKRKEISL